VLGVVLSGAGDDGTAGLQAIKAQGGVALVQDPADATFPVMPASAARHVAVDGSAAAATLGALLVRLVHEGAGAAVERPPPPVLDHARQALTIGRAVREQEEGERMNEPAVLSCPDCGGALWEMLEGRLARYRCHVGHAYSPQSLERAKAHALESALWTAVRMFRERAMLARRGATRARDRGMQFLVANLERRAEDAEHCSSLIEDLLSQEHVGPAESPDAADQD
jgi:two-component system chemotaxis response regulator CheB